MQSSHLPERHMVPHETVRKLQEMIERGQVEPGQKLPSQRILSEQLGISRSSLREAISILETIGLLRVEVGKGVFVVAPEARVPHWRHLGLAAPKEVYEFRYSLEGYAAGLAATRMTSAIMEELKACLAAMVEAATRQDLVSLASNDRKFHVIIVEASGNTVLIGSFMSAHRVILEAQRIPMSCMETLEFTAAEHRLIVEALETGCFVKSAQAMMDHIAATAERGGVKLTQFQIGGVNGGSGTGPGR